MEQWLGNVGLSILAFVLVLSLVVFVHEFGHFQMAKWLKIKIEKFSIGFGPRIFGWHDKEGVEWRFGAYPLGGYVKFVGDKDESSFITLNDDSHANNENYLHSSPVWVRSLITIAGPVANFLFSILVFAIFLIGYGEKFYKPIFDEIMPNSAASQAGFKVGDEVLSVNGKKITAFQDMQRLVITSAGRSLNFEIKRNNEILNIPAVPRLVVRETGAGDKQPQGTLGIIFSQNKANFVTKTYDPISAIARASVRTYEIVKFQIDFVTALFRGAMSPSSISGPLGIGQTAGMVAKSTLDSADPNTGFSEKIGMVALNLVELSALLSVAIGFMNLLPIPVLDGGHLLFYFLEAIRGKPVPENVQIFSYRVGLACLLSLFLFTTFQDLGRFGLF